MQKTRVTDKGSKPAKAYHHGDLRSALLWAVDALLRERGLEGLTLREIARRAGVSHGAPARHFKRLEDLLTEYAAESFEKLTAVMDEEAQKDALDALHATGVGYIRFAMENPERFRLMFRVEKLDVASARLQAAKLPTLMRLHDALSSAYRKKHRRAISPEVLSVRVTLAWCAVHGYAAIWADEKDAQAILVDQEAMLQALRPALLAK